MKQLLRPFLLCLMVLGFSQPATAVDPPYQGDMQELLSIMGSLYFLQPLCAGNRIDWREHAAELIDLDKPDEDRRQRLNGAFNQGYHAFARLHQSCTVATRSAITRLLIEADVLTRDIHARYAEQN